MGVKCWRTRVLERAEWTSVGRETKAKLEGFSEEEEEDEEQEEEQEEEEDEEEKEEQEKEEKEDDDDDDDDDDDAQAVRSIIYATQQYERSSSTFAYYRQAQQIC